MHGSPFEGFFTTAIKDRYNLISSIEAYERLHTTCNGNESSGGGRPLPYESTTYALKPLGHTKINLQLDTTI